MAATLRTLALRVVRGAAPDDIRVHLVKQLRDLDGRTKQLAEYLAAINWAQNQPDPDAAALPQHSVVATRDHAFIKAESGPTSGPWLSTLVSGFRYADDDVTELLQSGEATVIRVGDGV